MKACIVLSIIDLCIKPFFVKHEDIFEKRPTLPSINGRSSFSIRRGVFCKSVIANISLIPFRSVCVEFHQTSTVTNAGVNCLKLVNRLTIIPSINRLYLKPALFLPYQAVTLFFPSSFLRSQSLASTIRSYPAKMSSIKTFWSMVKNPNRAISNSYLGGQYLIG